MGSAESSSSWADDPITSSAEDEFNRVRFARLVADSIDATPVNSDSRVFGLIGPWGGGKSSVANIIRQQLQGPWQVAAFTPWAAADSSSLQVEFTATLASAIGDDGRRAKALRKALQRYAIWGVPLLKLIPFVGAAAADVGGKAAAVLAERPPWNKQFENLAALLRQHGSRVLIVCDDIDRLDAGELLEFLKVVRLLGRFPNVHYLVVYDVDTVEELLRTQGVGSRLSSFMEKIVQHPFELPAIDRATNFKLVAETLQRTLAAYEVPVDEVVLARAEELADILSRGLHTPRQQIRFREHLRGFAQLVASEVDLLDFAAVEFLRLNHHAVFNELPRWAADAREGFGGFGSDSQVGRKQWRRRLRERASASEEPVLFELLTFLFPDRGAGSSSLPHARGFASPEYLERYFNLGVPVDDVSDQLVDAAVHALTGVGPADPVAVQQLREVIEGNDPGRARLAIAKAEQLRRDEEQRPGPAGQRALLNFLAGLQVQVSSDARLGSPRRALDHFVAVDVPLAYASGAVDRTALLKLFGPERMLGVLLTVSARLPRHTDRNQLLADFAEYYEAELTSNFPASLQPLDLLRVKISLLARVGPEARLAGLLDAAVDEGPSLAQDLANAFVYVQHWYGAGPSPSSEELAFDVVLWQAVFSPAAQARLLTMLPAAVPLESIEDEDLSSENRLRFAVASARRALEDAALA